jgi:7-keto-8-aminopelargonate synthetase-like enzyme
VERSEFIDTVESMHRDGRERGLFFQTCADEALRGRRIRLHGRELLSFGSCSYLGLEYHPALIAGVHRMTDLCGTQFSSSRGYLSMPYYDELEDTFGRIFEGHALVAPTTTLAHQAAFDALLTEKDAIVLDHQVHQSVQRAATLARASGTRVEVVRHEEIEKALHLLRDLSRSHRTVWFTTDGITSMYGDLAPVELLQRLLDVAPNVRLYIDDAHGMSWAGKYGRGSFLSRMDLSPRIVVATSLSKAFAAGGALLVFADPAERERVRMCGGPMIFSGPLQPPMIGAALACAKLHLEPELVALQDTLASRVAYMNRRMREAGLPLLTDNQVPIRFVPCGLPRVANEIAQRLTRDGLYVNVSMYPSVPMRRSGIRVGITALHTEEDIDRLVAAFGRHVPAVLAEEGVSRADLDELFRHTAIGDRFQSTPKAKGFVQAILDFSGIAEATARAAGWKRTGEECDPAKLGVQRARTIRELDRGAWDRALGTAACCSYDAMLLAESAFRAQPRPEHEWSFEYVLVRDPSGKPVCATFFTVSLQKDDMLMRAEVSKLVEERRKTDPYFLTSRVTMIGSGFSEGNHLWLDRTGPWRAAMTRVLDVAHDIHRKSRSDMLLIRDLPGDDPEFDDFMLEEGYVRIPHLDTHLIEVTWTDERELGERLPSKRRRKLAREIMAESERFEVRLHGHGQPGKLSGAEVDYLHALYMNVAGSRGLRMNMFPLPSSLFHSLLRSPAWEIGTLHFRRGAAEGADARPVAMWAAHRHDDTYAWLLCGLDYRWVESHHTYKQLIFQVLRRAREAGCRLVRLGMTADLEKSRWGSFTRPVCLYAQARDDYNAAVLREIVAESGIRAS